MCQTVSSVLASARILVDEEIYRLLCLPKGAATAAAGVIAQIGEPFCALVLDRHELSLVLPEAALQHFRARLPGLEVAAERCRLLTIDAHMEPELTGLVSRVSAALAAAGVPVLPFASFSRDHFLVPAERHRVAVEALERLLREAREAESDP